MKFRGVEFLDAAPSLETKRKQNSSLCVYVLHNTITRDSDGKEMYQKVKCTCEVVVLVIKPMVFFFYFLVAVASVVDKAP